MLTLGCNPGSTGTYNFTGGYLSGNVIVGESGTGTFLQSGGTQCILRVTLTPLQVGGNYFGTRCGSGTYVLSDTGMLSCTGGEMVGVGGGSGTFTQSGGTNNILVFTYRWFLPMK